MNNKQSSTPDTKIIDQKLVAILMNELQDLFSLFQDGIINDEAFVGGLPMSYLNTDGSLEALTLEESKQIRQALMESTHQSNRAFGFSLLSLINWISFLKENDDEKLTGSKGEGQSPAIIDSDGYISPLSEETNLATLIQTLLNVQGLSRLSVYWNAINEKLQAKKNEEKYGDLRLIDTNRRKLIAQRFNATPFERAAQQFSVHVSSRFCDVHGGIISPESLEEFTNKLIDYLLQKTKQYWSKAPLLSLFDAIVVPVLRPMLYSHQTWVSEFNILSEGSVLNVSQFANKRSSFETTPIWSDSAQQQALHFVEKALNRHLSLRYWGLRLFDTFSPYNREIHSSLHMNPSGFKGKTKSFGPPAHTNNIMQLIQPIPKKPEDKILDKVLTYRSTEEGMWY